MIDADKSFGCQNWIVTINTDSVDISLDWIKLGEPILSESSWKHSTELTWVFNTIWVWVPHRVGLRNASQSTTEFQTKSKPINKFQHVSDVTGSWGPLQKKLFLMCCLLYIVAPFNNSGLFSYSEKNDFVCLLSDQPQVKVSEMLDLIVTINRRRSFFSLFRRTKPSTSVHQRGSRVVLISPI